ncbi:MAG: nitroreductase family protein [Deltaproteobacteria bacterium]|nr:nitroreductase family protein [Deltaproteobacteria bacterium]MBZ0219205.1 nitroreductase family protein [Deltaproteobacteria bacterium]
MSGTDDAIETWEISEGDFPSGGSMRERLSFLVNYAVLAPSSHNTQPWLFSIGEAGVDLLADRTRALPIADPDDRSLTISCGAALFNLFIAARHFGLDVSTTLLPDEATPDLLASISVRGRKAPTDEESRLFGAIKARRTNRMPFDKKAVRKDLIEKLKKAARSAGAWLHIAESMDEKERIAALVAEGDRIQAANRQFRRELAAWIHPNRSRSRDGMPGYAFGMGDLASSAGPFLIRTFDWGKGRAAKDKQLASGSPLLAVLGTKGDSAGDWLVAGMALSRVLLLARSEGVWGSYLNQPIEVAELRPRLGELVGEGFPQLLMRMGYGPGVLPTPRRPANEVIL